jgi:hypothetical protein
MRLARAIVLLGSAYALAGCGASAGDEVQAKLQQFAHAVAGRDAATLCHEVLAPRLVAHLTAAGLTCDRAMETFFHSVADPTLAVSKVRVTGASASAVVLTGARGQTAALEAVELSDTKDGWRVTSLGSPR